MEERPELYRELTPSGVPDNSLEGDVYSPKVPESTLSTREEIYGCAIEEALQSERKDRYTLNGKVVKISEVESYNKKSGTCVHFFTVTIWDRTAVTNIRIYRTNIYSKIVTEKSYRFKSVVRRAELFLFLGLSSFCRVPSVIAGKMEDKAMSKQFSLPDNSPRKLHFALEALNSSLVKGKIVKVSPLKQIKEGTLFIRHLALIDCDGKPYVKVAVFQEEAKQEYTTGSCVTISYVYPCKYKVHSLSTTKDAQVQPIKGEECEELSKLSYTQQIDDPDFYDQVDVELLGVDSAGIYDFCPNTSCSNQKLAEGAICPSCHGYVREKSCWARMVVIHNNEEMKLVLFKSELESVFRLKNLAEYQDDEGLKDAICEELEVNRLFRAVIQEDKIIYITRKRPHDHI